MSKRNATIGAAVGFGGAALCIVLALAYHIGKRLAPYLFVGVVFWSPVIWHLAGVKS